jgi:hypothetical protein
MSVFFVFSVSLTYAADLAPYPAGLVPCSGPDCQACHLIAMTQGIITWFIGIMSALIALIFIIGGLKMVTSGGSGEAISSAKSMMTNAIIGLVIMLAAWLIVDTIFKLFINTGADPKLGVWNTIECVAVPGRTSAPITSPSGGGVTSVPGGGTSAGQLTDLQARKMLSDAGISVNKTEAQGTSLQGINDATVQDMVNFKKACNCDMTITAGTESTGGHNPGVQSHGNGYKYDMRMNTVVDGFITTNYQYSGVRSDGAKMYTSPNGSVYAQEQGDPPHWDVLVKTR